MPELPEVETVVMGLRDLIVGKEISFTTHDWERSFPNSQSDVDAFLNGSKITYVRRKGKAIIIGLDTDYLVIVHLKMTGQLVYIGKPIDQDTANHWGGGHPNDSLVSDLPDRSTRVTLEFTDNSRLFFNDQRKFGYFKLLPAAQLEEVGFINTLGPDALTITPDVFYARLKGRTKSIKGCLLDQTIIAGCGNSYADESLWTSQIHPSVEAGTLSKKKVRELLKNLQDVLELSIDHGGSSSSNYVNAEGTKGSYLTFANVYGRSGKECNRCGMELNKSVVASRGTVTCSKCQKPPSKGGE